MRTSTRLALVAFLVIAGSSAAAANRFHLHLQKSEPADKSEVAAAPTELKLWFSEKVELPLLKVMLLHGADTVATAAPTQGKASGDPIVAKISKPAGAGAYTVKWRAMGKDGHAVSGVFGFRAK